MPIFGRKFWKIWIWKINIILLKKDCTDYSEISNSCCFFKTENGKRACFQIGRKYIGDSKEISTNINGVSVTYECKSINLFFNLYSILLIILLF